MRKFALSKKLLLSVEIRIEKAAYNGEAFACLRSENLQLNGPLLYNSLEDRRPMKGNTVGSRSNIELAYIAGFLDGDGSMMLQIKKRSDIPSGYRFMATVCLYQDTRHEQPLFWIQNILKVGYISRRNDKITELRINGYKTVYELLESIEPYIRFKSIQLAALKSACMLLQKRSSKKLTETDLRELVDIIVVIQQENYSSHRKRSKEELLKIFNLTP